MSTYEFDMGGSGEVLVITAQWEPDPDILEAEMVKMANSFADWTVPMTKARQVMIENTRRRFREENEPSGKPWDQLSDEYWHDKVELGGFPDQILVRTDAMRTAATSQEAWLVTERDIFFNVEALPTSEGGYPYGVAHQAGADRTKGGRLPQRMFIGADIEAANEIEAIFLDHMYRTIEEPWNDPLPPGPVYPVDVVYTTTGLPGKPSSALSFRPGYRMVSGYLPSGRYGFLGHYRVDE